MTPYIIVVNRLSYSLYIVMMMNSSVRRGRIMVDLMGGETVFPETIRGHGGIVHELVRVRLDGRRDQQFCWDCTKLPRENLHKQTGAKDMSQFWVGTS